MAAAGAQLHQPDVLIHDMIYLCLAVSSVFTVITSNPCFLCDASFLTAARQTPRHPGSGSELKWVGQRGLVSLGQAAWGGQPGSGSVGGVSLGQAAWGGGGGSSLSRSASNRM